MSTPASFSSEEEQQPETTYTTPAQPDIEQQPEVAPIEVPETGEQPDAAPETAPEVPKQEHIYLPHSTLPQDVEGESHGGPLGCCLGVVVGLFVTMLVMFGISIALANGGYLGIATLPIALLGGIGGGYLGWRLGGKYYRVYEPPVVIDKRRKSRRKKRRAQPK